MIFKNNFNYIQYYMFQVYTTGVRNYITYEVIHLTPYMVIMILLTPSVLCCDLYPLDFL